MERSLRVVIRGGGDLGSGVALRLHRAGMHVTILEIVQPTMIRTAVSLGNAVYRGSFSVEDVTAKYTMFDEWVEMEGKRVRNLMSGHELELMWRRGEIPVIVDPDMTSLARLQPDVLVDAIIAKRNLGTHIDLAPIVVALGPGFCAGVDCHAVVETQRGHNLGRVYYSGEAQSDTGTPGEIGGQSAKRAVRAPRAGVFKAEMKIGDRVVVGQSVGQVDGAPVVSQIDGVLRGVLHDGLRVPENLKVADVDPRGTVEHCFTVSDKSWAVGGGALEAILHLKTKSDTDEHR